MSEIPRSIIGYEYASDKGKLNMSHYLISYQASLRINSALWLCIFGHFGIPEACSLGEKMYKVLIKYIYVSSSVCNLSMQITAKQDIKSETNQSFFY